jgi:acetyl-CoA carboxylase / biotin carboxylase 1
MRVDAWLRLPGPMLEGICSAVIDGAVTAMVAAFPAGLAPTMVAAQPKPSTTTADPVGDYVKAKGGSRPIRKILIANNGMAATKSILSMRQWAYMELGDEKLLEFVAMATPEDLNANAEFIRLADSFVEVPAGANKNNYANVDLIIKTAVEAGVDAVWPGWGHASEKPALPNGLDKVGIKFIGPRGPIMYALGDKIAANILAQSAGVSPRYLVCHFVC